MYIRMLLYTINHNCCNTKYALFSLSEVLLCSRLSPNQYSYCVDCATILFIVKPDSNCTTTTITSSLFDDKTQLSTPSRPPIRPNHVPSISPRSSAKKGVSSQLIGVGTLRLASFPFETRLHSTMTFGAFTSCSHVNNSRRAETLCMLQRKMRRYTDALLVVETSTDLWASLVESSP